MNWMGGVRNRLKVKNERKRQQDFFEKKKFSSKLRKLEATTSPSKRKQAISLDLLSLQAANFSAAHFKKNGTGIRSSGRVNRVDLEKSRGSFRQKFVNLPDASPETKPSALNLSQPSPQESVSCPKLYQTSQRRNLSTIAEDKSPSVDDINNQDLSQMEQSHFWTSTPANFWHKKKKPNGHNATLGSKHSFREGDDHDALKKEPGIHSLSTSEKLLLDGSRDQMMTRDDSDYWAGKMPGSSTSGWSDLSTIMEDTDEATVPSIDDDDWDYHDVRSNQVSSQSFSESVQLRDVPTSQWTLRAAGEEPLSNAPDSTLSSFKDCHKMEYPIGGFQVGDSTRLRQHATTSEQYSSSHKTKVECQVDSHPHPEHITSNIQPAYTLQASNALPPRAFHMDPALSRNQLNVRKVRKRDQVVNQQQNMNQNRDTDHHSVGQAQQSSLLHHYGDMKEQRDLACHESTSFTSPEDSGTYLMTERAKMDNYRQQPSLQDSKADQRHVRNDTWHCPTPHDIKAKEEYVNAVKGCTSKQKSTSAVYSRNDNHEQMKHLHPDRAIGRKCTRGQVSGHQDTNVDIMNLYSSTKQILQVGGERKEDMMQVHQCSREPPMLTQVLDEGVASVVDNQDDDISPIDVDGNDSAISDNNNEDDVESSTSADCSSTDGSPNMDLVPDTYASSINNWLEFVHDVSGVNGDLTERKVATELEGDARLVKDVPATAQQMLEEVLALDRELHKKTVTTDIDDMSKSNCVLVGGKDRSVEKLSGSSIQSNTKDTPHGVHDITSPMPDLKTLLRSSSRDTEPEETGREEVHEAQGIGLKSRHGQDVEGTLCSDVSSSQTEETSATLLQKNLPDNMTKAISDDAKTFACGSSSLQTDLKLQTDAISTTVATNIIDEDPDKMPSVVSTSTSAGTYADSKTQGEKILCHSSIQCTLIGDPLTMPQGRGMLEDADSCTQTSDSNMPSLDVVRESSACDSIANTLSSHENDFESCVSTP